MHNFHILRNPNFQLDKVLPLENGSLVTFINNYVYAIVGLLNDFSNYVETKLIDLTHKIDNCYSNLVILEMKLNSLSSTLHNNQCSKTEKNAAIKSPDSSVYNEDIVSVNETKKLESSTISPGEFNQPTFNSDVPEDENLKVYKKMLRFGVNENAVRLKMLIDGIDPSLLNL